MKEVRIAQPAKTINSNNNLREVKITHPLASLTSMENATTLSTTSPAILSEQPINIEGTSLVENAILDIGGLTLQNDGQYILLDGKEPGPGFKGKLTGTYRVTILDKKNAVKKYGEKGKNGAIILETTNPK